MDIDTKILTNKSNITLKVSHIMTTWGLSDARWFNVCKSLSVIHPLAERRDKNRIITSRDAEKAIDKIQTSFHDRNSQLIRFRKNDPNTTKVIYEQAHIANIISNSE
jgi:hypothetical protein